MFVCDVVSLFECLFVCLFVCLCVWFACLAFRLCLIGVLGLFVCWCVCVCMCVFV